MMWWCDDDMMICWYVDMNAYIERKEYWCDEMRKNEWNMKHETCAKYHHIVLQTYGNCDVTIDYWKNKKTFSDKL